MGQLIIVLHILACISLVALVLMQQGKGADVGAAFGSGASNTVFGSSGSSSFLFKLTAGIATLFFVTSLILSNFSTRQVPIAPSAMVPVNLPTQTLNPNSSSADKENTASGFVLPVDTPAPGTKK